MSLLLYHLLLIRLARRARISRKAIWLKVRTCTFCCSLFQTVIRVSTHRWWLCRHRTKPSWSSLLGEVWEFLDWCLYHLLAGVNARMGFAVTVQILRVDELLGALGALEWLFTWQRTIRMGGMQSDWTRFSLNWETVHTPELRSSVTTEIAIEMLPTSSLWNKLHSLKTQLVRAKELSVTGPVMPPCVWLVSLSQGKLI